MTLKKKSIEMSHPKTSIWTLRPRFLIGVAAILLVLIGYPIYLMFNMQGGKIVMSPDGKARLYLFGPLDPKKGDAYQLHLDSIENEASNRLMRLTLITNASTPAPARGAKDPIQWSPESDYADIVINGERLIRVFVPGTASAPPPPSSAESEQPAAKD